MPVKFVRQNSCYDIHEKIACDSTKLKIKYDGSGRRISKTRLRRDLGASDWAVENVTHYTGIGTEVRETHVNGQDETKVVVNMPQGLGRYTPEDAVDGFNGVSGDRRAGYRPPAKFEWYLKNHIGSTMLVYGTSAYDDSYFSSYKGGVKAAYDYRAFGERVSLAEPTDKVTENFTGKEKDDETELNYFGARYLDPMIGMWTSVDPARQFASPYLYAGNGYNPIAGTDPDGMYYEDGERCTEGKYVPSDYQGTVTPAELDELAAAERKFMASPGIEETLMSMARYTLDHGVETKFWYNGEGQNSFGSGNVNSVKPGGGSGNYLHIHTWRSWQSTKNWEGLSDFGPGVESDMNWSSTFGSIMAYELRTGRIYYGNKPKMGDQQFILMQLPAGKVYDAQEFDFKSTNAR